MIEGNFIVRPAALFPIEPERLRTYAELEVRHPRRAYVYHTRHYAGTDANEENAHPSRPRVVSSLDVRYYIIIK